VSLLNSEFGQESVEGCHCFDVIKLTEFRLCFCVFLKIRQPGKVAFSFRGYKYFEREGHELGFFHKALNVNIFRDCSGMSRC